MSNGDVHDYVPQIGPMVGYAVTVEYICSDAKIKEENPDCYMKLYEYLASVPGPKVIIAKDLDAPNCVGSIFGEVTANAYHALGCVGAITNGYVRDVDEGSYAGFKMMASRLGVGHAYSCPIRFGTEVEIFGAKVRPGMLIHADKYGFIAIPPEDTEHLLEGVRFMDSNECQTTIPAGRDTVGLTTDEVVEQLRRANAQFAENAAVFRRRLLNG
ncbi:MAG: RraA family protein [Oscillospiraceae bacterium]|nr:RraA family protein [Oscillospiraceae bacterium]